MKELNDHVEVMIESIDDNLELIQDEYVITDIPEGFEMTYYNSDECSIDYNYQKGNYSIKFLQAPVDIFNINLDNEHSEIEHSIDSDGQEYIIRTSSDSCTYVWSNGEYAFQIYSNLNKNEVLELCRSTKIKK